MRRPKSACTRAQRVQSRARSGGRFRRSQRENRSPDADADAQAAVPEVQRSAGLRCRQHDVPLQLYDAGCWRFRDGRCAAAADRDCACKLDRAHAPVRQRRCQLLGRADGYTSCSLCAQAQRQQQQHAPHSASRSRLHSEFLSLRWVVHSRRFIAIPGLYVCVIHAGMLCLVHTFCFCGMGDRCYAVWG